VIEVGVGARSRECERSALSRRSGLLRNSAGPEVDRNSCDWLSLLVQVTVVPVWIVTLAGLNVVVMLMSIWPAAVATTLAPTIDRTTATRTPITVWQPVRRYFVPAGVCVTVRITSLRCSLLGTVRIGAGCK